MDYIKNYNPYSYILIRGITCQLMNYLNNKVIACFYGEWDKLYFSVFNTTDFEIIPELGGQINIEGGVGGQLFVSNICIDNREKAVFCAQLAGNWVCYGYEISNNIFSDAWEVTSSGCRT